MTAEKLCLILLGVTVALVIFAELKKPARVSRIAGITALLTILAADYYLFVAMNRRDGWLATEIARLFPDRDDQKRQQERAGRNGTGGTATASGAGQSSADDDRPPGASAPSSSKRTAYETLDAVSDWFGRKIARPVPAPVAEESFRDCPQCPEMVRVPAADIQIGSPAGDATRQTGDEPARRLRIWPGFALSRGEITLELLSQAGLTASGSACTASGATAQGAGAGCVTPALVGDYLAWLNSRTGKRYRLPSAAEWEFAARLADTTTPHPEALGGGLAELVRDCWPADQSPLLADGPPSTAIFTRCSYRMVKDAAEGEDQRWRRFAARRAVRSDFASPRIGFRVMRDLDVRVSSER